MYIEKFYTTSLGRHLIAAKRNLSMFLHGKKKPVDMDLYVGDLLWSYNGQPTISQYYLAARYLDAKLVKDGIYDYSYCEEISKAYRGTANSKEKTIEYMKKFRDFLDELETNGFNPTLGRFSIANDSSGLFFDDGTHRLAGLLLNKVKYIPVRIEDRNTKYDLNGRDILKNSSINENTLKKIEDALGEIRSFFTYDLFGLILKDSENKVYDTLSKYGTLTTLSLSDSSVNEKIRANEVPNEILAIYHKYKDIPYVVFQYSPFENALYLKKNKIHSKTMDSINDEIPLKNSGIIVPSLTESIETKGYLSRLIK